MTTDNKKIVMKRFFEGEVVCAKSNKTIAVAVKTVKTHPKYKKQYGTVRKYQVHDENGRAKEGDFISFVECRPMSKTKRWNLVKILREGIVKDEIA